MVANAVMTDATPSYQYSIVNSPMKKKNGKLVPNCVPKNESTYLRKSKKLPNLKVPIKRKPGNYTLADRIRGEKPKKLATKIDRNQLYNLLKIYIY